MAEKITQNGQCTTQPSGELEILTQPQPSKLRKPNYDDFISHRSRRRKPTALREIMNLFSRMSDPIALAVGIPNVTTFPFEQVSVKLKDGSSYAIEGKALSTSLQYLPTGGYIPLNSHLKRLMERAHGVSDWQNYNLLVTCGASEPMCDVFELVLNEGDPVVITLPMYTGTVDTIRPLNLELIGLTQDKDGILPQELRSILEGRLHQNKPMPKLVYVNPTGCNPTGRNLPLERKRQLYQVASDYNMLILEDDPYYHLQFTEEDEPSLLSMDVEGRVLRMDSFSKILSSGLRVGWVTGPATLIRQVELHMQVSSLHTSGLSQVVVSNLLDHWGLDGLFAHIQGLKLFYRQRRDLMVAACDLYLTGLAEWDVSNGGMFLWVRVSVLRDTWELVTQRCLEHKLLVVPGHPFCGDLCPSEYNYLRMCYSLASPHDMDQGVKLLAEIIKDLMKNQNATSNTR